MNALVCNESFLQPTTGEKLASKFRILAGRPTFKDRLGNITQAFRQAPKNMYYGIKLGTRFMKPKHSLSDKLAFTRDTLKDSYKLSPNFYRIVGAGAGLTTAAVGYAIHSNYKKNKPVQEGVLDIFKSKPTRWQRLKDMIGRNKTRIGTGALALAGAGWLGRSRYNYGKAFEKAEKDLRDKGYLYDKEKDLFFKYTDKDKKKVKTKSITDWKFYRGYGDKKLPLEDGVGVAKEACHLYNENFITDAVDTVKSKVGNAYDTVKNTVQRNVGNIANAINTGVNSAKEFAGGVADKIGGLQNRVSNFASNVVGSKNVKPVNNKQFLNSGRPFKVRPNVV